VEEGAGLGADGRRGADAAEVAGWDAQALLEAAEQEGDVGALGAVVGVELVEDQVLEGVGAVMVPEGAVLGAEEEEVEHPVIGEQEVGRALAEVLPHVLEVVLVGDDVGACAADVEAGADLAAQARIPGMGPAMDLAGEPRGLVGGERVHWIEDDRLDPWLAAVAPAMVEEREEEALGLARAGAGGDEGGARARIRAGEALPGAELVGVGIKGGADLEGGAGGRGAAKREAKIEIRAAEEAVLRIGEVVEQGALVGAVAQREGGAEVVPEGRLKLGGDDGGEHARMVTQASAERERFLGYVWVGGSGRAGGASSSVASASWFRAVANSERSSVIVSGSRPSG
jgi:hypothetical protein